MRVTVAATDDCRDNDDDAMLLQLETMMIQDVQLPSAMLCLQTKTTVV